MKKLYSTIIFLLPFISLFGQNLVINGACELFTNCPPSWTNYQNNYISYCTNWSSFGDTPDYFNSCSVIAGVPQNFLGYEPAYNGQAYVGLAGYSAGGVTNYREYLGYELVTPLIKDSCYQVTIHISLADSCKFGIDKFGATFTTSGGYTTFNRFPTTNFAHIEFNTEQTSKIGWRTLTGSFIADSTYTYLVLGNFYVDDSLNIETFNDFGSSDPIYPTLNYFYLDGISVVSNPFSCNNITNHLLEIVPKEKYIIKILNFMGIETEEQSSIPLIYLYSDGSSKKVIRKE